MVHTGDYFLIYQAFQPQSNPKPTYNFKLKPWELVVTCFEILESSRNVHDFSMFLFLPVLPRPSAPCTAPLPALLSSFPPTRAAQPPLLVLVSLFSLALPLHKSVNTEQTSGA
jgi:hypothetical protein